MSNNSNEFRTQKKTSRKSGLNTHQRNGKLESPRSFSQNYNRYVHVEFPKSFEDDSWQFTRKCECIAPCGCNRLINCTCKGFCNCECTCECTCKCRGPSCICGGVSCKCRRSISCRAPFYGNNSPVCTAKIQQGRL